MNRLDRECLGLTRSGTFAYKVQSGARHARLCSTDSITVVESTGRGLNCGLGLFEPLSQEEAESLVGGPNRSIVSVPVEPPKEEEPAAPAPEPPSRRNRRRNDAKRGQIYDLSPVLSICPQS